MPTDRTTTSLEHTIRVKENQIVVNNNQNIKIAVINDHTAKKADNNW